MGNVCCGSKEEASKATAFDAGDDAASASHFDDAGGSLTSGRGEGSNKDASASGGPGGQGNKSLSETDPGQMQAVKEEQARLEWIVQATGRRMVGVRTNRSAQGYYVDQGFAAALYQHLEQTTELPNRLPDEFPASAGTSSSTSSSSAASSNKLLKMLSAPTWDPIHVVRREASGGILGPRRRNLLGRGFAEEEPVCRVGADGRQPDIAVRVTTRQPLVGSAIYVSAQFIVDYGCTPPIFLSGMRESSTEDETSRCRVSNRAVVVGKHSKRLSDSVTILYPSRV
jgi:hypothetical protein